MRGGGDVCQLFGKQQIALASDADVNHSPLRRSNRSARRPFVIFVQLNQPLSTFSTAVYCITWRLHGCHVQCIAGNVKVSWGFWSWTMGWSSHCSSQGKLASEETQLELSALIFEGEKIHTMAAILAASAESECRAASVGTAATYKDNAAIAK